MWSNQYVYYNLYKDATLSDDCSTEIIKNFLNRSPKLIQVSEFEYKNKNDSPFFHIIILNVKQIDSWSAFDTNKERSNLVSIVCSRKNNGLDNDFIVLMQQLAKYLNWVIVEED